MPVVSSRLLSSTPASLILSLPSSPSSLLASPPALAPECLSPLSSSLTLALARLIRPCIAARTVLPSESHPLASLAPPRDAPHSHYDTLPRGLGADPLVLRSRCRKPRPGAR